jgi:hypothetical protein
MRGDIHFLKNPEHLYEYFMEFDGSAFELCVLILCSSGHTIPKEIKGKKMR